MSLLPQTDNALKRDRSGKKIKKEFANPNHIRDKVDEKNGAKPNCPYGSNCYRKNPDHFHQYSHTSAGYEVESPRKKQKMMKESRNPIEVWEKSCPHNFLLTTVKGIASNFNYYNESSPLCSLRINDILSEEFGDLIETAQFNYIVDVNWFLEQLPPSKQNIPILFVHGDSGVDSHELREAMKTHPNMKSCRVDLPPYGTHHTKMMFLRYQEGIRIVIHTSNLREGDWSQKTQGMWLSPVFPLEKDKKEQRMPFSFKFDLIDYLAAYGTHGELARWTDIIKSHDLSKANVILLGSVPGRHKGAEMNKWGHLKLSKALASHVESPSSNWPVIGQFSSIGSLGADKDKWLCSEWAKSLSAMKAKRSGFLTVTSHRPAPIKLIFPSVDDVRTSLEGYPAGGSVPYSYSVAKKQAWLHSYFHRWKATHMGRSYASPHIKSYTRVNSDCTQAAWFVLTSANMSKAAWGSLEKKGTQLMIRSFELGILFLPCKIFSDPTKQTFHLKNSESQKADFALPFFTPLHPYSSEDEPWIWDIPHKKLPDRNGNMWCPS